MRVILSAEANEDLVRLYGLIAVHNKPAAKKAVQAIRKGMAQLEDCPNLGKVLPETNYREHIVLFAASAYVLRYRVEGSANLIIIRIWHIREDRFH